MDYDGLVRSAGAARIPIQFVANSASSSRNKQLEGHDPYQPVGYHQRRQQQQQQRTVTSARDNHVSSINGRATSPPVPHQQPSPPRHTAADPVKRLPSRWDSDARPLTVVSSCRPDRDRRSHGRSRQRSRPADDRSTRARVQSDSRPAASRDSLRRSLVTLSGGTGGSYSSGDDSADDIISQTRSTSTHCPGQTIVHHTLYVSETERLAIHVVCTFTQGRP